MVASMANRPPQASKSVTSQGLFQARSATGLSAVLSFGASKPATHRRLKTGHRVGGTGWKNPLNRTCWQGCWRQLLAV